MKRFFVGCFVLCFIALPMSAQTPTFVKGDKVAGVSIGLGGYYSGGIYTDISRIPLISLYYEQCIKDNLFDEKSSIGIGGMLGYTQVKFKNSDWKASTTILGVRGALHYEFVNKLDTYAGLMLGYNIYSWKGSGWTGNSSGDLALGVYLGARYYFTDSFAVLAEIGYGAAYLNLGVALKF